VQLFVTLAISGVIGLNVIKIVQNVEKFILFNILKSEMKYYDLFWNGMAVPQRRLANFLTLIGCHGNVPLDITKRGQDDHRHSKRFHLV